MRVYRWIGLALALAGAAASGSGQEPEGGPAGESVRLGFPARPGVCGTGDGILIREGDGSTTFLSGRVDHESGRRWRDGDPPCRVGDVVVTAVRSSDGSWAAARLSIDDYATLAVEPGAEDRGYMTGQAAADLLLGEVRGADGRTARTLILAASLARDAMVWPELAKLARDRTLGSAVRGSALHGLGRRAAREAVATLDSVLSDPTEADEIRAAAVFALSQLPPDQAVPRLIEVVRTIDDARVRSRALFWLADFDDPRAVELFESILAGSASG